jgi:hypothetical protein
MSTTDEPGASSYPTERVIPHKVTIDIAHRHVAEGDGPWTLVQRNVFLGWRPPLPRAGDIVTCLVAEAFVSGSVNFVTHEYRADGVVIALYVDIR